MVDCRAFIETVLKVLRLHILAAHVLAIHLKGLLAAGGGIAQARIADITHAL